MLGLILTIDIKSLEQSREDRMRMGGKGGLGRAKVEEEMKGLDVGNWRG